MSRLINGKKHSTFSLEKQKEKKNNRKPSLNFRDRRKKVANIFFYLRLFSLKYSQQNIDFFDVFIFVDFFSRVSSSFSCRTEVETSASWFEIMTPPQSIWVTDFRRINQFHFEFAFFNRTAIAYCITIDV